MSLRVYAGCYAPADGPGGGRGIRRFLLDPDKGLRPDPGPVPEGAPDASFLALRPDGRVLYAVHELDAFEGASQGALSAYAVDPATGDLAVLDRAGTGGAHPCHASLAVAGPSGMALVANYTGGNAAAFPLAADGRLGPAAITPAHVRPERGSATGPGIDPGRQAGPGGPGIDPGRQAGPHAHCILPHPSGRFAYAVDLGADAVFTYALADGTLRIASVLPLPPGRGPRHLAFHPSGTIAYLVGELEPVLSVLAAEEGTGALRVLREMPLVPAAPGPGRIYPSEVKVHPSARLLAAALRGAEGAFDGFALFRLDASGDPSPAGHVPSGGDFTRHFAFDAAGRFLVAAHQKGNALSAFRVDADAATLTPLGEPVSAPAPSCVLIA